MRLPFTFVSLFTGIGGIDLGLERAGMTAAGQVEIDPWCRKVLAKHWPEVPRHDDVRTAAEWWGGRAAPDLVCGGFPCQPVSEAGYHAAQDDPRWLWPAFADVVRALRPRIILVENVPGLLDRGMGDVLGDLASLGYDAEWSILSACALGAPHARERLFLVANASGDRWHQGRQSQHKGQAHLVGAGLREGHGRAWSAEPRPHGVAYGVPHGMDRNRGLGNAVVPQVAEHIGRLILAHAERAA